MFSIKKVALLLYLFVLHATAFAEKEKDAHDFDDTELKQLIDTIPDESVNKKVHVLLKEGKCEEAENEIHDYFDVFAEELKSHGQKETADDLENQREDVFKKMDAYVGSGKCNDVTTSFEISKGVDERKVPSRLDAKDSRDLIDTIPDKAVKNKVHDLMKEGKCKEAENEIHDYYDTFVEELKSQGQKEDADDLENQRENFFKAMDDYVEGSGNCIDLSTSFELLEKADEGKANDLSAQQLKQLIDTFPEPVNEKVQVLLEEGKCKEAENEIHHYFDVFVEELKSHGQKEDAGALENQREDFFKKMDEYVEGSVYCIDISSEKKYMEDKLLEVLESMAEQNKVLEDYLDELNDAN